MREKGDTHRQTGRLAGRLVQTDTVSQCETDRETEGKRDSQRER